MTASESGTSGSSAALAERTLRALVCDDDPLTRQVVSDLLTDIGFRVVAELDVAPAVIDLAHIVHPDVIVLDVSLMGMTGIEALPALRAAAPGCAVIVYSSFDTARAEALQAGAVAVVDKTRPDDLEQELRRLAEARGR